MELRAKSRLKPTRMRHSSSLNQNGNFDSLTVWNEIVLRYRIQAFLVFMALRVQPKACLFVSRVSAFECLLPDELNPYLQKSPGYSRARWYVSGSPYLKTALKTTPPENSLAGRRYCGNQAIDKPKAFT